MSLPSRYTLVPGRTRRWFSTLVVVASHVLLCLRQCSLASVNAECILSVNSLTVSRRMQVGQARIPCEDVDQSPGRTVSAGFQMDVIVVLELRHW